jgi:hypothetical protein
MLAQVAPARVLEIVPVDVVRGEPVLAGEVVGDRALPRSSRAADPHTTLSRLTSRS